MKTLYTFCLILVAQLLQAQFCGNSGPQVCIPYLPNDSTYFFYPTDDSVPCFYKGNYQEQVISGKNPDSIIFGGNAISITIKIDFIENLPCGLCWATNRANNTFPPGDTIAIKFSGIANDTPGQYNVHFSYSLSPNVTILEPAPPFRLRVQEVGQACFPVSNSSFGLPSHCFTGIDNLSALAANVYLEQNDLRIESEEVALQLSVYDLTGRSILSTIIIDKNSSVPFHFPSGIYLAYLHSSEGSKTVKLVKP